MKKVTFNSQIVKSWLFLVLSSLSVLVFSQQTQWSVRDTMPFRSAALSACYFDGKIYTIGGSDGKLYNNEYGNDYFMIYDLATQSWSLGPSLPSPRMMLSVVESGGKIYAIGGGYPPYLKNINECYDPATGVWTSKSPMPISTSCSAACNVDGLIYIIGGYYSYGKVHCYDPLTDTWTEKATMPFKAAGVAGAVLEGKIYVTGGVNASFETIDKLQIYDPSTNTWDVSKAAMDTVRFGHSMGVKDGKIIVLAGCVFPENKAMKSVSAYDPANDTWADLIEMPDSLQWGATCGFDDRIFIMGGEDKCMMTYTDATIFNYFFELSGTSGVDINSGDNSAKLTTYPNPFSNNITVRFKLDISSNVKLELIDLSGKVITQYVNEYLPMDNYSFEIETTGLMDGMYYLRLNNQDVNSVKKIIKISY